MKLEEQASMAKASMNRN